MGRAPNNIEVITSMTHRLLPLMHDVSGLDAWAILELGA